MHNSENPAGLFLTDFPPLSEFGSPIDPALKNGFMGILNKALSQNYSVSEKNVNDFLKLFHGCPIIPVTESLCYHNATANQSGIKFSYLRYTPQWAEHVVPTSENLAQSIEEVRIYEGTQSITLVFEALLVKRASLVNGSAATTVVLEFLDKVIAERMLQLARAHYLATLKMAPTFALA